jgi:hypothetical protein
VFSLSNGTRLESISLRGIVSVDPYANLLCAHDLLYSLRYVGERLGGSEEVTDDNIIVDAPSTVFGNLVFFVVLFAILANWDRFTQHYSAFCVDPAATEGVEKPSWSRSDSLFLKDAIANAEIEYWFLFLLLFLLSTGCFSSSSSSSHIVMKRTKRTKRFQKKRKKLNQKPPKPKAKPKASLTKEPYKKFFFSFFLSSFLVSLTRLLN